MSDLFQELLNELGKVFHLALTIDKHHACSIQIHETMTVQLQLDMAQENLFLFSKIVEIPPGKFRENVLREALKANALPDPRSGILAYLAASNQLVLFQLYPIEMLNGERLSGFLGAFIETGEAWQKAVSNGQASPPNSTSQESLPNPFGLR